MQLSEQERELATVLIADIDSGEKNVFLENLATENQIAVESFYCDSTMCGVFFSCMFYGLLRIHVALAHDCMNHNERIARLIQQAMDTAQRDTAYVWFRNETRNAIKYIKEQFTVHPQGDHFYASTEYIMCKEEFKKRACGIALDSRPYEREHIDEYLHVLDEAMDFASPPPNFRANKAEYEGKFTTLGNANSFEAFWQGDELVGLYWRKDAEIDIMVVAPKHQRFGYGTHILDHAIESVFLNTSASFAYLYAVDWNLQGRAFYDHYGMKMNGHSYGITIDARQNKA